GRRRGGCRKKEQWTTDGTDSHGSNNVRFFLIRGNPSHPCHPWSIASAGRAMLVGKEIGPFRIESELGSGAMGSVYRAVNTETGQRVAIKFIALGLLGNETAVKRFE